MSWKKIPTYKEGKWSYTTFESRKEWIDFLKDQFKIPGKYRLKDTHVWKEAGLNWLNPCDILQYCQLFSFR